MKITKITSGSILCLAITAIFACNTGTNNANNQDSLTDAGMDTATDASSATGAHADISATKADTTGSGSADFTQNDDGTVEMKLEISFPTMANKSVAVHLHEHGDCSDAGKGAHGHWNPTNEAHGKWGASAFHSGDIGNVELDADGRGTATLSSDRWSIGGDEKTNILNRAVIVHSGVDDYTSQPTGDAGSRIGCGLIATR